MNNLTRYFNQNRKMIWIIIFVVIFVIIVIQLLNSFYKNSNKEEVGNSTSSNVTQKDYTNESQAMVQGSIGSKEKQDELERQRLEQEKIQAERKAREEAKEKARLEKQKLKNSPEYKKRRADRDAR